MKNSLVPVVAALFTPLFFCSPPALTTTPPPVHTDQPAKTPLTPTLPVPHTLAISSWTGHAAILKPINPLFARFGYELTKTGTAPGASIAPGSFTKKNRLAAHFALDTVKVTSVLPREDGEFTVLFFHAATGCTLSTVTAREAVSGVTFVHDLKGAQERFLGKTIFARKGQINRWDSTTGKVTSLPVSMRTPLTVTAILPGITPIPPAGVRVMVKKDTLYGFIPTNFSWTTVPRNQRLDTVAWHKDLFERSPEHRFTFSHEQWEQIERHKVVREMTTAQVRLSWNEPQTIRRDTTTDGTPVEYWRYQGQELMFQKDTLREIRESFGQ